MKIWKGKQKKRKEKGGRNKKWRGRASWQVKGKEDKTRQGQRAGRQAGAVVLFWALYENL